MRYMILLFLLLFNFSRPILASDNIFGLHLTQTSDIQSAKEIINSSGGDWGWATIVIRPDQLDKNIWQDFFNNCRRYHIIPIIRLASKPVGPNWTRPDSDEIDKMATFLNSLIWPTKIQHIILYNEINHGQEWGGQVDIKNYVNTSLYIIDKYKTLNPNFFILSTGLDLAAPSKLPDFESANNVYQQINNYKPQYFELIDGIASHSYPNHGFIGNPNDTGQYSILGYKWELEYLKSLGVKKELPVFITETGWPHREGIVKNNKFYTTETTANFYLNALNIWQGDKNIKAVTPFIYNYPNEPFDHFSWLDSNEKLYPTYQKIVLLQKSKNDPEQIAKHQAEKIHLPLLILPDHQYSGRINIKNTGQTIWNEKQQFCLDPQITINVELDRICLPENIKVEPQQFYTFDFNFIIIKDSQYTGKTYISWEGIREFEIAPIIANTQIYRPKIGVIERIKEFFILKYKK